MPNQLRYLVTFLAIYVFPRAGRPTVTTQIISIAVIKRGYLALFTTGHLLMRLARRHGGGGEGGRTCYHLAVVNIVTCGQGGLRPAQIYK